MSQKQIKYFLAANSCEGFVSYFDKCYYPKEGWKAYIIKGGPGTGKSTFMKQMAKKSEDRGVPIHLCPCSSDPKSLDAVVFPTLKAVIMDGTAPHTVDPIYPAAVETILNFGDFWNGKNIEENREQVIRLTDVNKSYHKTASAFLKSAGTVLKENRVLIQGFMDKEKINQFTNKLCKKYIKKQGKGAKEEIRFLSGVSPQGIVNFEETVYEYCKNPIIIKDDFGTVSDVIMDKIRQKALEKDYKVIIFKNPFLPQFNEHIIIPELNVAFVRESRYFSFSAQTRRIHAKRFMNCYNTKRVKQKEKIALQLIDYAVDNLKKAKDIHDELEKIYKKSMVYEMLDRFNLEFAEKFFG